MRTKLLGCLAATAMAAAIVVATPAMAFRGGGGFGGGHMGGFGGGHFGGFGGGHFGGFGGRSMAMGGFNRGFNFNRGFGGVNRGMFTGRSVAMNRGLGFNRGFNSRFARFDHFHHFHDRFFFRNRFFHDRFAFFPVFVGGGWGYPYGNGCWRWDGWQWINICYDYGGYNYGY